MCDVIMLGSRARSVASLKKNRASLSPSSSSVWIPIVHPLSRDLLGEQLSKTPEMSNKSIV